MKLPPPAENSETVRKAALELASACQYDASHTHQVTRLALILFDQLAELHGLGADERYWLEISGLLHDIGWVDGQKGHHKASLQIIMTTPILPLENRERLIVGTIARYHRKALPKTSHDHFAALKPEEQEVVNKLSAILRLADGLDCTHTTVVSDIKCLIGKKKVSLTCLTHRKAREEEECGKDKGDLFELVFDRRLEIECKRIED